VVIAAEADAVSDITMTPRFAVEVTATFTATSPCHTSNCVMLSSVP